MALRLAFRVIRANEFCMTRSFCSGARACCTLVLSFLFLGNDSFLFAAEIPPKQFSVLASATVQESPPEITLGWPADLNATGYTINRRTIGSGWNEVGTLPGNSTSFIDPNVTVGTKYEYQLIKTSPEYTGYGYLASGIRVPVLDYFGKIVVVVESTLAGPLAGELDRLQADLIADGWGVLRRDVSMNDSPAQVKEVIRAAFDTDPLNVHAVLLFGHVPVPYSGDIFPDGHPNHQGAWPADVFYGDLDGVWTDDSVTSTNAERQVNWNVPGDGKFDQSRIPSSVELMVGRVDFNNMTCYANKAFSRSELDLARQYLNKNHAFRTGQWAVQRRGLICDNFGDKGDDPIAGSAWRAFPGFFGAENIEEVPWDGYFPAATAGSYLWSYGSGGGTYYYSMGVGTSDDFALQDVQVVFTMFMGSYFGDWNNESNFLRAALGSGSVLTASYSGFPHTLYFPMGLGEPIGHGLWISQNNADGGLYPPWPQGTAEVHISLHGDPTLRMYPVKPPGLLTASSEGANVNLSWGASADSAIVGYHVYRSTDPAGPFEKVTAQPMSAMSYVDAPSPALYTYMVRAIKLEESGSGTFLNPSEGVFAQVAGGGAVTPAPAAPVLSLVTVTDSRVNLAWTDVANETGYRLETRIGAQVEWTELTTFDANTTSFEHTGVGASTTIRYRLAAFNSGGDSPYSAEVTATTIALAPNTPTLQVVSTTHALVSLQWNDVQNETGYVIERSTGNGTWSQIASVSANMTAFVDDTVAPSSGYRYRISATGASGNSAFSAEVAATTQSAPIEPPAAPFLQASAISDTAIQLTWTDVEAELAYHLESKTEAADWREIAMLDAGETSYQNSGLQASTRYYYRIRASNEGGVSPLSAEVSSVTEAPPLQPPMTPELNFTGFSHSSVELNWNDVSGESGYRLERRRASETSWTVAAELDTDRTAFTVNGLSPSTAYFFRIAAFNEAGASDYSTEVSVTTSAPPLQPPAAPVLRLAAVTHHSAELAWGDVENAAEYSLERRSSASDVWTEITRVAGIAGYLDAGLSASSEYRYRMRALNPAGASIYSEEVIVATQPAPLQPPLPPVLQVSGSSHEKVSLSWTDVENETAYLLERRIEGSAEWIQIARLETDVTSFENFGVTASTTFSYRLRATNAAGSSEFSAEVSVTTASPPLEPPAAPVLQVGAVSHAQVSLAWDDVERETSYLLQRRTGGESTWATIASPGADVTSHTDSGVSASSSYEYRIQALNAAGAGGWSGEVAVTTPAEPVLAPSAPALQATAISHSEIKLEWTNVENESGYVIEELNASESWTELTRPAAEITTFSVIELAPATTYQFRIRAVNSGGASAWSEAEATTSPTPVQSSAVFVSTDSSTSGLWPLEYGVGGIATPSAGSTFPSEIALDVGSARVVDWAPTTPETRALIDPSGTNRSASAWLGGPLILNLGIARGSTQRVALYFLDWERNGAAQIVSVRDSASGTELDSRTITDFGNGKYVVYEISGGVSIVISSADGDASLSGVLLGQGTPPPINDRPLLFTIEGFRPESLRVRIEGETGQRFKVQSSADFQEWTDVAQSILLGNSAEMTLPKQSSGSAFFRALNTQ